MFQALFIFYSDYKTKLLWILYAYLNRKSNILENCFLLSIYRLIFNVVGIFLKKFFNEKWAK